MGGLAAWGQMLGDVLVAPELGLHPLEEVQLPLQTPVQHAIRSRRTCCITIHGSDMLEISALDAFALYYHDHGI